MFVGREGLLEKIHAMFLDGARTVYLEGMGGIGKSELAKQYAITRHEDYDTVIFFTYEGSLRQAICDQTAVIVEGLVRRPEEDEAVFFHGSSSFLSSWVMHGHYLYWITLMWMKIQTYLRF